MIKHCKQCKNEFNTTTKSPKVQFCSEVCLMDYLVFKNETLVNSGKANYRTVKNYLIKYNGHHCEICGLTHWRGETIPLVLDHKDGDSTNNTKQNCRLVCNNCDALLPTYKGKNKGKGRWSRKIRYQQGKSY